MRTRPRSTNPLGVPYWLAVGGIIALLLLLYLKKMLTFDNDTESKLSTLQAHAALKMRLFLAAVRQNLGYEPLITSAKRTAAQQTAMHQADKRNPLPSVNNTHMNGLALDLNFKKAGVIVLRKADTAAKWSPVVKIADSFGLTWGGRFTGYADNVHFDAR